MIESYSHVLEIDVRRLVRYSRLEGLKELNGANLNQIRIISKLRDKAGLEILEIHSPAGDDSGQVRCMTP